jgi:hypothetical protein
VSDRDYAVAWTRASRRSVEALREKVGTAVIEFLYGSLADNPRRVGKELKLALAGLYSEVLTRVAQISDDLLIAGLSSVSCTDSHSISRVRRDRHRGDA